MENTSDSKKGILTGMSKHINLGCSPMSMREKQHYRKRCSTFPEISVRLGV